MRTLRSIIAPLAVALALAGGCQLVSGLDGLHAGTGGAGGASSSSASSSSASSSGSGGDTSSSSSNSSSSTSASVSSSAASSSSGDGCGSHTTENCCGVPCGQGTCKDGYCTAYPPFDPETDHATTNLVIDQGIMYWGAQTNLRKGTLSAGGPSSSLVPPPRGPVSVAVAAGNVYWADSLASQVQWASLSMPTTVFSSSADISSANSRIVAVKQHLVWSEPDGAALYVASLPDATLLGALSTSAQGPFTADDEFAYWTQGNGIVRHVLDPTIDAPSPVGTMENAGILFADPGLASSGSLYWAVSLASGGEIRAAAKDGTGAHPLLQVGGPLSALIADQSRVYWIETDCTQQTPLGHLRTATLADPMNTVVDLGEVTGCEPLAQDATALYWAENNGAIQRLVKPLP